MTNNRLDCWELSARTRFVFGVNIFVSSLVHLQAASHSAVVVGDWLRFPSRFWITESAAAGLVSSRGFFHHPGSLVQLSRFLERQPGVPASGIRLPGKRHTQTGCRHTQNVTAVVAFCVSDAKRYTLCTASVDLSPGTKAVDPKAVVVRVSTSEGAEREC